MPRWDFECQACGRIEEHSFPSFARITPPVCPYCEQFNPELGPHRMVRLASAPGVFVLKGAGFHKNDYPK